MRIRTGVSSCALVTGAVITGLAELALLQGWRVREWLLRQAR